MDIRPPTTVNVVMELGEFPKEQIQTGGRFQIMLHPDAKL